MDDVHYLRVPKDGSVGRALGITVDHDFEIAIQPVSVAQYEAFCAATGYRTIAERGRLRGSTYFDNSTLFELSSEDRANAPAVHLSYIDAQAFCEWTGYRLPREEEWMLAAMVAADEAKSYNDWVAFHSRYESSDDVLKRINYDITSTQPTPTTCVIRRGPYIILPPGGTIWDPERRLIVPLHRYRSFQFRVCKRRPV